MAARPNFKPLPYGASPAFMQALETYGVSFKTPRAERGGATEKNLNSIQTIVLRYTKGKGYGFTTFAEFERLEKGTENWQFTVHEEQFYGLASANPYRVRFELLIREYNGRISEDSATTRLRTATLCRELLLLGYERTGYEITINLDERNSYFGPPPGYLNKKKFRLSDYHMRGKHIMYKVAKQLETAKKMGKDAGLYGSSIEDRAMLTLISVIIRTAHNLTYYSGLFKAAQHRSHLYATTEAARAYQVYDELIKTMYPEEFSPDGLAKKADEALQETSGLVSQYAYGGEGPPKFDMDRTPFADLC